MTQERKVDFGFGCMRLPVLQADQPDSFDYEKINRLFDAFLEKGFAYFDTAPTPTTAITRKKRYAGRWWSGIPVTAFSWRRSCP